MRVRGSKHEEGCCQPMRRDIRLRMRICVRGVVQGGASGPVYSIKASSGLSVCARQFRSGDRDRRRRPRCRRIHRSAQSSPAARSDQVHRTGSHRVGRRHRFSDRGTRRIRPAAVIASPRTSLWRAECAAEQRSEEPALPPRFRPLHRLRSAIHDHRLAALRPDRDGHQPSSRCAPTAPASMPTRRSPISCPTRCCPNGVRTGLSRQRGRIAPRIRTSAGQEITESRRCTAVRHRRIPPGS